MSCLLNGHTGVGDQAQWPSVDGMNSTMTGDEKNDCALPAVRRPPQPPERHSNGTAISQGPTSSRASVRKDSASEKPEPISERREPTRSLRENRTELLLAGTAEAFWKTWDALCGTSLARPGRDPTIALAPLGGT